MADSTQTPPQAPPAQAPAASPPAPAPPPATPPGNRRRALLIVAVIGLILAVGGFFYYQYAQTYESTDDAQVDCHLVGVASRIQGTVTAVHTDENQFVKAGEVVVEIDPRDFQVAAAQAKAELTQSQADIEAQHPNVPITQVTTETSISTGQAEVQTAEAAVSAAEHDAAAALGRQHEAEGEERQAEANNAKAQADLERYQALVAKDEIPRTQFDQIVASAKAQSAAVDSAQAAVEAYRAAAQSSARMVDQRKAQLAEASSRLAQSNRNAPQQLAMSQATLRSKQAQATVANTRVERALLDISYTNIVAPVSGVVGKRSVEIGSTVQPGQQLFTIAQIDDLWVTANFKETQLRRMGPGQRVEIKVDAFGQTFGGFVESMPGASGSITSLLPPENATGNFVKVVQRLPVRIRFDKNQSGLARLRPGMSVEPKVWLQ
jgi:membrane fusion protein (multidrug efflux system)